MTELRDEMTSALSALDPGPAPVEDTMRRGRAIKARRRAATVAGGVAVLAAVLSYPVFGHHMPEHVATPAQHSRDPVVTDTLPAKGSAAGLVAEGQIDASHWQVTLRAAGAGPARLCMVPALTTSGRSALGTAPVQDCDVPESTQDPAKFTAAPEAGTDFELGAVAPDVAYFVLTFSDGQQLKLIPVTVSGHRYVAYAAPLSMPVASLTAHLGSAHSDSGLRETAIPFRHPDDGASTFSAWLRPGQSGLPRVTVKVGSGTVSGAPWTVSAYQGPWGTCIDVTSWSDCVPASFTGTGMIAMGPQDSWAGTQPGLIVAGSAAVNVAHLEVTMSDGTVLRNVTPVRVGQSRLFAFAVPQAKSGHWTAYSASGAPLKSGTISGT